MLYACLPNLMQVASILAKAGRCALTLPLLRRDLRTQPERESEGGGDSWPSEIRRPTADEFQYESSPATLSG